MCLSFFNLKLPVLMESSITTSSAKMISIQFSVLLVLQFVISFQLHLHTNAIDAKDYTGNITKADDLLRDRLREIFRSLTSTAQTASQSQTSPTAPTVVTKPSVINARDLLRDRLRKILGLTAPTTPLTTSMTVPQTTTDSTIISSSSNTIPADELLRKLRKGSTNIAPKTIPVNELRKIRLG